MTDSKLTRGMEVVDRRRHRRQPLEVPILVDGLSAWETCQTHDLSAGGLAVVSDRDWGIGAVVDLYFELPEGWAIETQAHFLGHTDGVGHFRFFNLPATAKSVIGLHMQKTHHSGARRVQVG